jgi:hypothetical protein
MELRAFNLTVRFLLSMRHVRDELLAAHIAITGELLGYVELIPIGRF